MKWLQPSERPEPPNWFVQELKLIDPTLRVVWAQERYLKEEWAIERKIPAERYWLSHESLLQDGGDRFIDQPVFDNNQPIKDEDGHVVGYTQVGTRKFDLAPEWEWIAFRPTLDNALLVLVKKLYWEHNHPEKAAEEQAAIDTAKADAKTAKRIAAGEEGIGEAFLESRKVVQFGYGDKRNET